MLFWLKSWALRACIPVEWSLLLQLWFFCLMLLYIYIYYLFIINWNWAHARWQWVQADIHPQVKAHTSHKTAHTYKKSTRHNTSKMTLPSKYSDNLRKHRRNSNTEYTPSSTEYTLSLNIPSLHFAFVPLLHLTVYCSYFCTFLFFQMLF
jgi:hypothetical protein